MERKSGFKECPRCGLRNKPSAAQCDFCGWEFRDVSDEWISHVQVLEKLNRATESIVLDDEVSRRIESTIVRSTREVPPAPAPAPEMRPAPVPAKGEELITEQDARPKAKEWPERRIVLIPSTTPVEDREVKTFVETMIGEPVTAQAAAVVNVQASEVMMAPAVQRQEMIIEEEVGYPARTGFLSRYYKLFLAAGVVIYVATLALYSISYLSVPLGWGLAIAGAVMVTIGVSHFYDTRVVLKGSGEPLIGKMSHSGDEVVICPRCHEEVSEGDSRCSSCGAAFSR